MEIPPSDSRQPPDGHEFPDFVETTSKVTMFADYNNPEPQDCPTNFKSTWSQPVIKPLDRSISSSNYDLRPKMTDSDEEKYDEPVEKTNLLHSRSQSLIDMSIFSKEKSSSKWNTLMEQRKSRLSKLKGLVIPEAAENDVTPLLNIPEIKSIASSQIELSPRLEYNQPNQVAKPVPISTTLTHNLVLPNWSSNTSLPKYSPAFKRKSLQVYPLNNSTKKSDSSDAESSYDEYMSKYSDIRPSRTTDDPKSLESIASPTRSDCSFDYTSLKTNSVRDHHFHSHTKDFADSDNDSAVSSSQSSYNSSRSSPPPSPMSDEKFNGQNRMLKPSSVEAINRKNILASAKCRSGKDIKIGSPVIQRKGSLEEEKTETPLQLLDGTDAQKPDSISTEDRHVDSVEPIIVLKEEPSRNNLVLLNEPVVLEVNIERPIATAPQIVEKLDEKPVPTKRMHAPLPVNDIKPQNEIVAESRFDSLLQRHSASSILDKRNKPVNVRSLKANFENSATQSLPVFPKNYKADGKTSPAHTPPELANGKPMVNTRRRSEEFHVTMRRKSDEKLLFRQMSHEEKPKIETRRLSNSSNHSTSNNSIAKDEPARIIRTAVKGEQSVLSNVTDNAKSAGSSPSIELRTVELNLDASGGSLGITLAGGVDYENKNIMIHRIRYGSIAYQDGQLKKGDKVVSINGHQTAGLTHSAATELLKVPSTKFAIVIEESKEFVPSSNLSRRTSTSVTSLSSETRGHEIDPVSSGHVDKKPTHSIVISKDGGGLGFSIEGGKDSPKGDVPLVIKKIFTGGAADKSGELKVGDEVLLVNKINLQNMSRIEAWSQMKKIPEGSVTIEIFR